MFILIAIKTILGKIIGDWRILLVIMILVVVGLVVMKIRHTENIAQGYKTSLETSENNNIVLKGNIVTLNDTNSQNEKIINQLRSENKLQAEVISKLNSSIASTNKSISDLKSSLNNIKEPPAKITPYIQQTLIGILNLRKENAQ